MGVYIKGMEMPKDNCEAIRQITIINNWIDGEIKMLAHDSVTNEFIGEVVKVPEPHGRLVDADALLNTSGVTINIIGKENAMIVTQALDSIYQDIEDAPTVIESEE